MTSRGTSFFNFNTPHYGLSGKCDELSGLWSTCVTVSPDMTSSFSTSKLALFTFPIYIPSTVVKNSLGNGTENKSNDYFYSHSSNVMITFQPLQLVFLVFLYWFLTIYSFFLWKSKWPNGSPFVVVVWLLGCSRLSSRCCQDVLVTSQNFFHSPQKTELNIIIFLLFNTFLWVLWVFVLL